MVTFDHRRVDPLVGDDTGDLRIREAVRAVVVDPDHHVLLVRFQFPGAHVWATPGGGMEPGEDAAATLRRELDEELGLLDVPIGPHIWDRLHIVAFLNGQWDGQRDRFYLVDGPAFDPRPRLTWEQLNAEHLFEIRWWSPAELAAFAPTTTEFFAPRRLPELFATLLADGPPSSPIDTGP